MDESKDAIDCRGLCHIYWVMSSSECEPVQIQEIPNQIWGDTIQGEELARQGAEDTGDYSSLHSSFSSDNILNYTYGEVLHDLTWNWTCHLSWNTSHKHWKSYHCWWIHYIWLWVISPGACCMRQQRGMGTWIAALPEGATCWCLKTYRHHWVVVVWWQHYNNTTPSTRDTLDGQDDRIWTHRHTDTGVILSLYITVNH